MTSGFDIEEYQAELEAQAFEASRARLEAHDWQLVRAGEGEFGAWKRADTGVMYEISLPTLDRLEESCAEYDAAQAARSGAARERAREHERLEREERLKGSLARSVRQAEQRWAAEQARRDSL